MLGISFWLSMSWAFYHLNLKGFLLLQPEWDDAEVTRYQRLRRLKPLVPGTLIIQWLLKKCISHLGHSLLSDSPPWLLPEYWFRSWAASLFRCAPGTWSPTGTVAKTETETETETARQSVQGHPSQANPTILVQLRGPKLTATQLAGEQSRLLPLSWDIGAGSEFCNL